MVLYCRFKYLAITTGIEAANTRFSCIWCKCPSEDRHDMTKVWSVQNEDEGARTIASISKGSLLHKTKKKYNEEKCGCIQQPLFPSIPIDHVVPDILYSFLRVSDVLLIVELRRLDGINKNTLHFDKYIKFLNEDCKVSFHMYQDISIEMEGLNWKVRVFNNIDFSD